ncbi:MAG: putative hydroxymethylpyrimidine transporter CytX [Clostridiaceae bacterium]|nr:putative hydroxymethylpyrimidine transporter CytX [Clostridiaceae bacterium]
MKKKTSVFSNGLIWFGAGISITEILSGTYIAPLGLKKGIIAILLGHLIGCFLLYLLGVIGGRTEKSSMETVKMSFGKKGALFFSVLNVLQLVGWTAVMIISGAKATSTMSEKLWGINNDWIWSLVIGFLIILWIVIGIKNIDKVNYFAVGALFILTIVLSFVVFGGGAATIVEGEMSFGAAVELCVAMPVSWIPLIADYTRVAEKPKESSFASAATYFIASSWMNIIGMGAAIFTGESDISIIMFQAGIGILGVFIIIVSTVTTTFLDSYSAGVSSISVCSKIKEKPAGIVVTVIGILIAIFVPMDTFEDFLYLISSVFAPMAAIQIVDYFILKKESFNKQIDWFNILIWGIGFIIYRFFMNVDTLIGYTVPVMLIVMVIDVVLGKIRENNRN